ncbi:MAG: type II toxin-antitoxin system YoeB family toxin [Flavobacteriaceae bacterium]|nr:type II toxin-antitoxin system YoeB family toxin [Flavobacteriaceae bacterium]
MGLKNLRQDSFGSFPQIGIDLEHRLVYRFEKNSVVLLQSRKHYESK